ncbi:hypothetical protein BDQ17DRAFT_1320951 [Cyathus striatus]|nr:hypothetical protein BDQ17DRAFT_1320951 [Cyathus striatus]
MVHAPEEIEAPSILSNMADENKLAGCGSIYPTLLSNLSFKCILFLTLGIVGYVPQLEVERRRSDCLYQGNSGVRRRLIGSIIGGARGDDTNSKVERQNLRIACARGTLGTTLPWPSQEADVIAAFKDRWDSEVKDFQKEGDPKICELHSTGVSLVTGYCGSWIAKQLAFFLDDIYKISSSYEDPLVPVRIPGQLPQHRQPMPLAFVVAHSGAQCLRDPSMVIMTGYSPLSGIGVGYCELTSSGTTGILLLLYALDSKATLPVLTIPSHSAF